MAEHARRRTMPRRVLRRAGSGDPFIAALPRDDNWMAALWGDDAAADGQSDAPSAGPAVRDGVPSATLDAVREALDEQRAATLELAAKVDEIRAMLASLTAAGSGVGPEPAVGRLVAAAAGRVAAWRRGARPGA